MSPNRLEPRSDRSAERLLLTLLAVSILGLGVVLGITYLALWTSASEDLTRLLPASTRAYAQLPAPWAGITRALGQPLWRDRNELRDAVLRDGYLASEVRGEIAGLPIESVREILRTMDGLEVAVVPTGGSDSVMVFVELADSSQRKRVTSRMKTLVEAVSRHVGFRIDRVRTRPWQSLAGQDLAPPRVVEMEPWLVFAWGPPIGLEDLLDARVGGRHDAMYRRPGFAARDNPLEARPLRLVIDAGSAWRVLADEPEPRPGGLVEFLDLLTLEGWSEPPNDLSVLQAELSDRELAAQLVSGLTPAPHELAGLAPEDALFVISATGKDLAPLVGVLRTLAFRLQRDFEPSAEPSPLATTLIAAAADLPVGQGELAFVALPSEGRGAGFDPVVLVRSADPSALEAALARSLPARFGDTFAHGVVLHRGEQLHLELPHGEGEGLAWRQRRGLIELAPSVEVLDRFASATRTLSDSGAIAKARAGLPRDAAIAIVARADLLARFGPMPALVQSRLAEDLWLGVTIDAIGNRLEARSNLGLWTLVTALASGTRAELDDLAVSGLAPRCREAYDAFCTLYPEAVPCRPFALGRIERIEAVCRELGR